MHHRFLCPAHRGWLLQSPQRAAQFWQDRMNLAQTMLFRGHWHEALPHAGGAFEAAQLMVADAQTCSREWLRRRAASRNLLQLVGSRICARDSAPAGATVH